MTLPCGPFASALVGALSGPAHLRAVIATRHTVTVRFEHPRVGRLELTIAAGDERARRALRELRTDRFAFTMIYALLACALQLDGRDRRFRYELVNQLTHGPRNPTIDRSWLNRRVDQLLVVLGSAVVGWTPRSHDRRAKRSALRTLDIEPLLKLDVLNRKSRTIRLESTGRELLERDPLVVMPSAFTLARPCGRQRPPAAVRARLRLAALVATGQAQRGPRRPITFQELVEDFAWVPLDRVSDPDAGSAEAAARTLRPRLREALVALTRDLADPADHGTVLRCSAIPPRDPGSATLSLRPRDDMLLYFVQAGLGGAIKIGVTRDLAGRMATLQTASPTELRLLGCCLASTTSERDLHARFAHARLRGEWFRCDPELLAFIARTPYELEGDRIREMA